MVPGSEEKHPVIGRSWALPGGQGPHWPLLWFCVMDSNVSCKVQECPDGSRIELNVICSLVKIWWLADLCPAVGLANSSCSHCCSGFLWWRAEDPSLLRLRGHHTAPTSVNTHPLLCVRSNKPANLFRCCCPVITHTFLLRHSLYWDFSIDVWPDLSVSNMTANKSSIHWADPIWPDRDKMTGAGS